MLCLCCSLCCNLYLCSCYSQVLVGDILHKKWYVSKYQSILEQIRTRLGYLQRNSLHQRQMVLYTRVMFMLERIYIRDELSLSTIVYVYIGEVLHWGRKRMIGSIASLSKRSERSFSVSTLIVHGHAGPRRIQSQWLLYVAILAKGSTGRILKVQERREIFIR